MWIISRPAEPDYPHVDSPSPSPMKRRVRFPCKIVKFCMPSFQQGHLGFDSLPCVASGEVLHEFEHDRSTVLNERRRTVKELQAEPCNRIALMHRLAAIALKSLEQIVGEQFDQQIQFIRFDIACRDAIDREAVFGFLDVIFHTAALVVEPPQINRLPFQIGDDRFILPIGIEHEPALTVVKHLRFSDDRHPACLFPGCRFVDQGNPFDDPIFVDIARPIAASLHLLG